MMKEGPGRAHKPLRCRCLAAVAMLLAAGLAAAAPPTRNSPANAGAQGELQRAITANAASDEDLLLAAMISLVTTHDIAIIAGVLPFPAVSWTAELVEFGSNLALKTLPPRLFAPDDLVVEAAGPEGPGYTRDGCSISFPLLAANAGYSNLFGIANLREPYTQLRPLKIYPWRVSGEDTNAETRWGFLRAPRVYHANSDVNVEIHTAASVQRYDTAAGAFTDTYTPIDTFAEAPQVVHLPIGQHAIEWRATTQLDKLGDVAVPGVMLVVNLLTELKNAYGGTKAAKVARDTGIGAEVAEEALDPEGAKRLSDGVLKFNDVWKKAFDDRQARKKTTAAQKATEKLRKELRDNVSELVCEQLRDTFEDLAEKGISSLSAASREEIRRLAGPKVAAIADAVYWVFNERYPAVGAFSLEFVKGAMCGDIKESLVVGILARLDVQGILDLATVDTASVSKVQRITVLDTVPPTLDLDPAPLVIEATDFGGTRLARVRGDLLAYAEARSADNCGRTPEILIAAPQLLPLGEQEVTFIARDRGPNPAASPLDFAPRAVQRIVVRDTQPPLLLAPPGKVILDTAPVPLELAAIGAAATVDLVDVQPRVANDAPEVFPVNARTEVRWSATDASGNAAHATQLITVKDSNTPPTANAATAATITAQPVDIRLTASDPDELGGRTDPVWFRIDQAPARGEFVAPLYPFFIEDYRTRPNDGLGPDFDPVNDDLRTYIGTRFCSRDLPEAERRPPRGFVHNARYVHVTDDGIRYVLDDYWVCDQFDDRAVEHHRFSRWTTDGAFLGQLALGDNDDLMPINDTFRVDRDGFLYYNTDTGTGSSNELRLWRCRTEWSQELDLHQSTRCTQGYGFDGGSAAEVDAVSLAYARIDSRLDVAYVVDGHSVLAFELLDSGGVRYLGELGPQGVDGLVLAQWFGRITSLEVGSDGALYANDDALHRIHKIAPPKRNEAGDFTLGEYIGWAGKCTGSANNACDLEHERSRGYSCTYAPESCSVSGSLNGARQGQFDTPRYVALDPNDILYVADYQNGRIQRLAPDGSFAGEAVSTGSGINQGERPSFVLGNMGRPASVAVNSTQFHVVDRAEQFVHVFGTLPFKDITDGAATVTYVSDQDFPRPASIAHDSFTFSVTDGLERSAPATVTVQVSRAFRPPEALEQTIEVAEDGSIQFSLPARDPDGIAGRDFLGLDTLRYTLTRWPENGFLSGHGEHWTYTPRADFHGEDSLAFKVNDGRDDSNEATLTFRVTPVNDPPVIVIEPPARVALGFPAQIIASIRDDRVAPLPTDVPDGHTDHYEALVTWGDGSSDTTGEFSSEGGEAQTRGVAVIAPANDTSEGRAVAAHTWETTGTRTVQVCVTDPGGLQGCAESTFEVERLASLGVAGLIYVDPLPEGEPSLQEVPDGTAFTFEVIAANGEPSAGDGVTAQDVTLELDLPADLEVGNPVPTQGQCSRSGLAVRCALGALAPGAEARITMAMRGPGNLVYELARDFEATLSTSSAAINPDVGLLASVELIADTSDTDGDGMSDAFERTHGLSPAVDDAAGDPDGDGLANGDEYAHGTSPRVADTDGDGVHDGDEVAAGTDPRIDDIAPELTVPADITVAATGVLTRVALGAATAIDRRDGAIAPQADRSGRFPPGPHVVTWTAIDAAGNRATGHQFVNVVPIVNFEVDQAVAEGSQARVRVEINGPAVQYPVRVPYTISGTATTGDHDASDGEAVIAAGLATEIVIDTAKDGSAEPDEMIVLTMGEPVNAIAGVRTHTITVTDQNLAPRVAIGIEQQGRATTTIVSNAGLVGLLADVRDDPLQAHIFDWSTSDPALFNPVTVHDPAFLLDPSGLAGGLYGLGVSVIDDGVPPAQAGARSHLFVSNEPLLLRSDHDSDGDDVNDAAEGPADRDGDRIPDYLDDLPNANLLRLAPDGRVLEALTGVGLRLGTRVFARSGAQAVLAERDVAVDVEFGYSSDVLDFEITGLVPGGQARVVLPLAWPLTLNAEFRVHAGGEWRAIVEGAGEALESAAGGEGVCPPPASSAYLDGLQVAYGCLRLTLTDGGPNDSDGLADGVIRLVGGLAVPVSAAVSPLPQPRTVMDAAADGEAVMARTRLHSASGDAQLRSLTVQAHGPGDEREVDHVVLVHDRNHDGEWDAGDAVLATERFAIDDGALTLTLAAPLDLDVGDTDLLIVYVFGELGEE